MTPLSQVFALFSALYVWTPNASWPTILILWVVRIVTTSLLLRSFIIPWALAQTSKHVRIRSVSLRSIRGLYIRRGNKKIYIERIGYSLEGNWKLVIEGLTVQVEKRHKVNQHHPGHKRSVTLERIGQLERAVWNGVWAIYASFNPYIRPLVRDQFITFLRLLLRCVPMVARGITVEIRPVSVTFVDFATTTVRSDTVRLTAGLSVHQGDLRPTEELDGSVTGVPSAHPAYSITAWRNRFNAGFKRTVNKALEETRTDVDLSLRVEGIAAFTSSLDDSTTIFNIPDFVDFAASLRYDAHNGRIETHSLKTSLAVIRCVVDLDVLLKLVQQLKDKEAAERLIPEALPAEFPSPSDYQPLSSPLVSPWSRFAPSSHNLTTMHSIQSPIMKVLSRASFLSRRNIYPQCTKLKETRNDAMISFLQSMDISIDNIGVYFREHPGANERYKLSVRGINFYAGLSSPTTSELHRQHFGKSEHMKEVFDPDIYCVKVSTGGITLEHNAIDRRLCMLAIESIHLQVLMTQFPFPWLLPTPFFGGDPNGPLVVISAEIGATQLTGNLVHLTSLTRSACPKAPASSESAFSSMVYIMPCVVATVQCKTISARVIVPGGAAKVLEARSDGFVISVDSHYATHTGRLNTVMSAFDDFDTLPLCLALNCQVFVEPTYVRVRSRFAPTLHVPLSSLTTAEADFIADPVFISLEQVALQCQSSLLCDIQDDTQNIPRVDMSTLVSDVSLTSEAVCIELWHQEVVDTLSQAIPTLKVERPSQTSKLPRPLLDRLPPALSASLFLGRAVAFVVHPDLNPGEDMELLRGVALRVDRTLMQYCAMQPQHKPRFPGLYAQEEVRTKLHLPEEQLVRAFSLSNSSPMNAAAVLGLKVHDISMRSALATQFAPDDPSMAERDNPQLLEREFLSVTILEGETALVSNRDDASVCDVLIRAQVKDTKATFSLSHVYHISLAAQNLSHLRSQITPKPAAAQASKRSRSLTHVSFKVRTDAIHLYLGLPSERAVLRLDNLVLLGHPHTSPEFSCHQATGWVFVSTSEHRLQEEQHGRWKEFISLRKWRVSNSTLAVGGEGLTVEGRSARIRIPFGYVAAELIQDISISAKAAKHLMVIIRNGKFSDLPSPLPEGPKTVPSVQLLIAHFAFEMEDDPFEQKLALSLKTSTEAIHHRMAREEAFDAKVAAVNHEVESDLPQNFGNFSSSHSVSISEARARLNQVHSVDWMMRYATFSQHETAKEKTIMGEFLVDEPSSSRHAKIPNIIKVSSSAHLPPLLRILATDLSVSLSRPSFPADSLTDFLNAQGGLPRDTEFSLLVPLHLNVTAVYLRLALRDYIIPLFEVPSHPDPSPQVALEFDTDLVIAEEMGTELSVHWVKCPVSDAHDGIFGATPFALSVPKTIMPVKTYANPEIQITTPGVTTVAWAVSYGPAIQDLMRVIDSLTSAPKDTSPGLGFWDKMRLVLHWSIRASFKSEVRYYMKGLRDPRDIRGAGAGFLLSFRGHTKLLIGRPNDDQEIIQVISDTMMIAIPKFKKDPTGYGDVPCYSFRKVCAKVMSGVRFGLGFALERSCGEECQTCTGNPFHRKCRFFDLRPHHDVRMEKKATKPAMGSVDDSYRGFRSDFIHLSISLTSSVRSSKGVDLQPSSIHLSPRVFAHFWQWWSLFDSSTSLPIRQGTYYPRRALNPKFGRHLATLKYRIVLKSINIMHGYMDDSRETWADGVTPWIGVKAILDDFHVDMHQRDQETTITDAEDRTSRVVRCKPFYAAEVVLKGLDLRAILAIFEEPMKTLIPVNSPPSASNYRTRNAITETPLSSDWYDEDDFVEIGWAVAGAPTFHVLPVVACPHFVYFKRNSAQLELPHEHSKFGTEDTHLCLLGQEPTVPETQKTMATQRLDELKGGITLEDYSDESSICKKISLVQKYISLLDATDAASTNDGDDSHRSYHVPSDTVSPDEWAEFDNVYQVHCPKISLDTAVRDIMMQYYYCSRNAKGLEYHMANRAVTFLLEQAKTFTGSDPESNKDTVPNSAQAAALAFKQIIMGDLNSSDEPSRASQEASESFDVIEPLQGWEGGVSLKKSHCCLLLKPQIILCNREQETETCVVTALQSKIQTFAVMDKSHAEDPVSGKVMSRTFTSLSGMQTFAPTILSAHDGCVPLEVLIDFRCESDEFDRLVPQTDATFRYDKFNRLRLRNNTTSVAPLGAAHLRDQMDLVKVVIPRFTVTASDQHFKTISNIVSKLLLFTDAAHKTRVDKLETMLFTYDFTDLTSAANVIRDVQGRLRGATGVAGLAFDNIDYEKEAEVLEFLKLQAHIYLLSDELNLIFDAIKVAQDRGDDNTGRKSALLLNTESSEISWNMLDERKELLSKLVVQDIDFQWLSRRDSSTNSKLTVGALQAFDGSKDAVWPEIISKLDDPSNHPLLRRGLFMVSEWSILPPVGGITIYENFDLSLHPFRLQIDAKVGQRIMEYFWPARRMRTITNGKTSPTVESQQTLMQSRTSLDSAQARVSSMRSRQPSDSDSSKLTTPSTGLRRLGTSRSFTNMRDASSASLYPPNAKTLTRTRSSEALSQHMQLSDIALERRKGRQDSQRSDARNQKRLNDAAEMRTRSSQKTFVLVRIASLHILLSMMKEDSFVCHEARITTRDLEYRNQTWSASFEELVDQLIPSDTSWSGWVKMAFQQPLIPVLPVAREILKKTKLIPTKHHTHMEPLPPVLRPQPMAPLASDDGHSTMDGHSGQGHSNTLSTAQRHGWRKTSKRTHERTSSKILDGPLSAEPASMDVDKLDSVPVRTTRHRVLSLLSRKSDKSTKSTSSTASTLTSSTANSRK